MKKLLLTIAAALISMGAAAQAGSITIKGTTATEALRGTEVTVYKNGDREHKVLASSPIATDGTFAMTLRFETPGVYSVAFKGQTVSIWAEDENLTLTMPDRLSVLTRHNTPGPVFTHIEGGAKNEFMNKLQWETVRAYWDGMDVRAVGTTAKLQGTQEEKIALGREIGAAYGKTTRLRLQHLVTYYGDQHSVLAALPYIKADAEFYNATLARLNAAWPGYAPLKEYMVEVVEADNSVAVGQIAPDFTYPSPSGVQTALSSLRGEYVLIDFWASWCGPCRGEIPNLKSAYEKYHAKGFEIMSVSIDKDDAAWRKALADEAMPWVQVHAPDSGNAISKTYQFNGIPHIVLLDKEGRIIAKNLRGQALHDKLAELLK